MKYNPHIHHRKSIRLKGYDYAQEGLYYITICVQDRTCLFGYVGASIVGVPGNNWDGSPFMANCGNEIITNTLSATIYRIKQFQIILTITRQNGLTINFTADEGRFEKETIWLRSVQMQIIV